jgi:hypothetical protein
MARYPCPECGYSPSHDAWVERAARFPGALTRTFHGAADDVLRRRPVPSVWSPIEYAAHLGEAEAWYVTRIRRVLTEERPQLQAVDWDEACEAGGYAARSTARVLADVASSLAVLAQCAASVGAADLTRVGLGSGGGTRTVEALLRRAGHELVHHDWDINRVLGDHASRVD